LKVSADEKQAFPTPSDTPQRHHPGAARPALTKPGRSPACVPAQRLSEGRSGRGRPARAARSTGGGGGSKKRGRAFKFNGGQIAEFRKQVEGGKSTRALAKELKISLPTRYNTLKRAGWTGRKGRKAKAA
jgi:hypothetical protein